MKLLLIFFTFFSLYTTIIAQEEIRTPKYTLGYNIIPLLGNSNEFIIERSISKKFNAFINLGNTFGPTRGGIKIDDGLELEKMSGLFLKLGGRYHIYKDPSNNFSIGLAIIGSRYQESGIDESYSINFDTTFNREVSAEGFLVGLGTDFKYDTKIYKFIYLRIGLQFGFFKRNNYLGSPLRNYQPGFGSLSIFPPIPATSQGTFGLLFRIGQLKKSKE